MIHLQYTFLNGFNFITIPQNSALNSAQLLHAMKAFHLQFSQIISSYASHSSPVQLSQNALK